MSRGVLAEKNNSKIWAPHHREFYDEELAAGRKVYVEHEGTNYTLSANALHESFGDVADLAERDALTGMRYGDYVNALTDGANPNRKFWWNGAVWVAFGGSVVGIVPPNPAIDPSSDTGAWRSDAELDNSDGYKLTAHEHSALTDMQNLQNLITKAYDNRADVPYVAVVDHHITVVDGDSEVRVWEGGTLKTDHPDREWDGTAVTQRLTQLLRVGSNVNVEPMRYLPGNSVTNECIAFQNGAANSHVAVTKVTGPNDVTTGAVNGVSILTTVGCSFRGEVTGFYNNISQSNCIDLEITKFKSSLYRNRGVGNYASASSTGGVRIHDGDIGFPADVAQGNTGTINARQPLAFNVSGGHRHVNFKIDNVRLNLPGIDHDGSPTGRNQISNATADSISVHGADGGTITNCRTEGSGELGITLSLGCEGVTIEDNTVINDSIGAINCGISADNVGATASLGRNKKNIIRNNTIRRSCRNSGLKDYNWTIAPIGCWSSDDVVIHGNTATLHENWQTDPFKALVHQPALITASGARALTEYDNEPIGLGFAKKINEFVSTATVGDAGYSLDEAGNTDNEGQRTTTWNHIELDSVATDADLPDMASGTNNNNRPIRTVDDNSLNYHVTNPVIPILPHASGDRSAATGTARISVSAYGTWASLLNGDPNLTVNGNLSGSGAHAVYLNTSAAGGDVSGGGIQFDFIGAVAPLGLMQIMTSAGVFTGDFELRGSTDNWVASDVLLAQKTLADEDDPTIGDENNSVVYQSGRFHCVTGTARWNWITELLFESGLQEIGTWEKQSASDEVQVSTLGVSDTVTLSPIPEYQAHAVPSDGLVTTHAIDATGKLVPLGTGKTDVAKRTIIHTGVPNQLIKVVRNGDTALWFATDLPLRSDLITIAGFALENDLDYAELLTTIDGFLLLNTAKNDVETVEDDA